MDLSTLLDPRNWDIALIANYAGAIAVIWLFVSMVRAIVLGMMVDAFKKGGMAFVVFGLISVVLQQHEWLVLDGSAKAGPDYVVTLAWSNLGSLQVISFTLIGLALLATSFVMWLIVGKRDRAALTALARKREQGRFAQEQGEFARSQAFVAGARGSMLKRRSALMRDSAS